MANFTSGMTLFFVTKPIATEPGFLIDFGNGTNNNGNFNILDQGGTSQWQLNISDSSGDVSTVAPSGNIGQNQFQLLQVLDSGTTATISTNSVPLITSTSMYAIPNMARQSCQLGRWSHYTSSYYYGEIAEVLIYNQALTTAQQQAVQAYLASHYAPVVTPSMGVYSSAAVTMQSYSNGTVYLTENNTVPTTSSTQYISPVVLNSSTTVQARTINSAGSSPIATSYRDSFKCCVLGSIRRRPLV
jgi:hypothetical protein